MATLHEILPIKKAYYISYEPDFWPINILVPTSKADQTTNQNNPFPQAPILCDVSFSVLQQLKYDIRTKKKPGQCEVYTPSDHLNNGKYEIGVMTPVSCWCTMRKSTPISNKSQTHLLNFTQQLITYRHLYLTMMHHKFTALITSSYCNHALYSSTMYENYI